MDIVAAVWSKKTDLQPEEPHSISCWKQSPEPKYTVVPVVGAGDESEIISHLNPWESFNANKISLKHKSTEEWRNYQLVPVN